MPVGTILIIEVDPATTQKLVAVLRAQGYETVIVRDGEPLPEETLTDGSPELILYPGGRISTSPALQSLRKDPRLSRIPLLKVGSPTLH